MAKRIKYVTGNKAADKEIAYLKKTFPNSRNAKRQIKYLVERFGAQTLSGKAERSRTSARDRAPKKTKKYKPNTKINGREMDPTKIPGFKFGKGTI